MSDVTFGGGEGEPRRSMLLPILLALVVLAIGGLWFSRVYLRPSVVGTVTKSALFPVHVEFEKPFGTVGAGQTEDAIYVVAQVSLKDQASVPLFVKEVAGSFIAEDGSLSRANVISARDLPRLQQMYAGLRDLMQQNGEPLNAERNIAPGTTGSGYVVMLFNATQADWEKRKSAEVDIDFYHQDSIKLSVPK